MGDQGKIRTVWGGRGLAGSEPLEGQGRHASLKANHRGDSDVHITVSPTTQPPKPINWGRGSGKEMGLRTVKETETTALRNRLNLGGEGGEDRVLGR